LRFPELLDPVVCHLIVHVIENCLLKVLQTLANLVVLPSDLVLHYLLEGLALHFGLFIEHVLFKDFEFLTVIDATLLFTEEFQVSFFQSSLFVLNRLVVEF